MSAPIRSMNSFTSSDHETSGVVRNTSIGRFPNTSKSGRAIDVRMKSATSHASTPSVSHTPIASWRRMISLCPPAKITRLTECLCIAAMRSESGWFSRSNSAITWMSMHCSGVNECRSAVISSTVPTMITGSRRSSFFKRCRYRSTEMRSRVSSAVAAIRAKSGITARLGTWSFRKYAVAAITSPSQNAVRPSCPRERGSDL